MATIEEYHKNIREERKGKLSTVKIEFLAGTDSASAAKIVYDLACESRADVQAEFNDKVIIVMDKDMFNRFGAKALK